MLVFLTYTYTIILYRTGETKSLVRSRKFRYFRGSRERLLLPSSYLSVRPSVCQSVCLSVCLSVSRLYQYYHHWTDFCEIWYWIIITKIG